MLPKRTGLYVGPGLRAALVAVVDTVERFWAAPKDQPAEQVIAKIIDPNPDA